MQKDVYLYIKKKKKFIYMPFNLHGKNVTFRNIFKGF